MNRAIKCALPLLCAAALAACGAPYNAVTSDAQFPTEPEITTRSNTSQYQTQVRFDQAFYNASAQRHAAKIAELTQAFINLGPDVDPNEAARAARVVYTYVDQLVIEYQITDSPLVHNTKVNFGTKPRGLCWHWAHDIDDRLQLERFRTLEIHRAIANHNNLRLEHSTTMLGRRGDPMYKAIVLDPWRLGGELFWEVAANDTRYDWTDREQVFAYKRAVKAGKPFRTVGTQSGLLRGVQPDYGTSTTTRASASTATRVSTNTTQSRRIGFNRTLD